MFRTNLVNLISNDFIIYLSKSNIIIVNKSKKFLSYFADTDIIYSCSKEGIDDKDIIKYLFSKKDLPDDLREFIYSRNENIIGKEVFYFSDKESPTLFSSSDKFFDIYGFENPCRFKLTVIETFDNQKDFTDSIENGFVFGIWEINDNKISESFIYSSPQATQICFADFGTRSLSQGSLFVKMKVEEHIE